MCTPFINTFLISLKSNTTLSTNNTIELKILKSDILLGKEMHFNTKLSP